MKRYHCHKKMEKRETGYNGWNDYITVYVCRSCGLYAQYREEPSE